MDFMKYCIYARVSTDEQDTAPQEDNCLAYVNRINLNGNKCIVYQDPDTSSRLPIEKRLGLKKMLDELKKGDLVVTSKLDRLSRDIIEMVTIYRKVVANGAKIHSLAEPNIEEWMVGIFGSIAQKERENTSQRIIATFKSKRANGERVGRIPYGYTLLKEMKRTEENKHEKILLKPEPKEMEVLNCMIKLRSELATFREIAKTLNDLGYKNRENNRWWHSAVARIYTNAMNRNSVHSY